MRIEIRNNISRVSGTEHELAELDAATSYPVEGAQFSPAFKAGHWDGREHLLRASRAEPGVKLIPTGAIIGLPELAGAELVDCRRPPAEACEIEWVSSRTLRPYQVKAIDMAVENRGWATGRGMWNLPIRSGKTLTAAGLIQRLGVRTLFVVSSKMLLGQTLKSFQEALSPCPAAVFGDGKRGKDWITIATAQSLLARPKDAKELMSKADLLIVDEAHHLEGEAWRTLVLQSDAMFKIGLSATIFVSKDKANNTASIWLRACTGPILYRISMDRLFRLGFLMPPNILMYKCHHPGDIRQKDWHWVQKNQIANGQARNSLIADVASNAMKRGLRTLVDTGRHDQMKHLFTMINRRGVSCEMIHGETSTERRLELVSMMAAGEICLVGTVLGEGIDIPELEVVINAEGQKSPTASIQRMRNLTVSEGKGDVYFVDIADVGSPIIQKHSLERLKLYKGMRGFKVRACVLNDPETDPLMNPERSDAK